MMPAPDTDHHYHLQQRQCGLGDAGDKYGSSMGMNAGKGQGLAAASVGVGTGSRPPGETRGGLAGIRKLREQRRRGRAGEGGTSAGDGGAAAASSSRLRRRVEGTQMYLSRHVDPVMRGVITHLLLKRPKDVKRAMLAFFVERQEANSRSLKSGEGEEGGQVGSGIAASCSSSSLNGQPSAARTESASSSSGARPARREDRIYMADEIGPVLSTLINKVLRAMPTDVDGYLLQQLQEMIGLSAAAAGVGTGEAAAAAAAAGGTSATAGGGERRGSSAGVRRSSSHDVRPSPSASSLPLHVAVPPLRVPSQQQPQSTSPLERPSTARSRLAAARDLDDNISASTSALHAGGKKVDSPLSAKRKVGGSPKEAQVVGSGSSSNNSSSHKAGPNGVTETQTQPWDLAVEGSAMPIPSDSELMSPQRPVVLTPRIAVLLLAGMDGSGKTTLLRTLQGDADPRVRPTVGFKPVTMMLSDTLKVKFYDLGGGSNIRSIWKNYYHDVHGVVYMFDGSREGGKDQRWEEAKALFTTTLEHRYLRGKPLLLLQNKADLAPGVEAGGGGEGGSSSDSGGGLTFEDKVEELKALAKKGSVTEEGLSEGGNGYGDDVMVQCCAANAARNGGEADPRVEEGIEWLLQRVQVGYGPLNERVQRDNMDMEREFEEEKQRKKRTVLKKLLREKAFPLPLSAGEGEYGPAIDCLDVAEGVEFLSSEVGVGDGQELPTEALEVGRLVNHQKLALQMIGAMIEPVSKKNRRWQWTEVLDLIRGLRKEVGIDV